MAVLRPTARVLLVDHAHRTLLFRGQDDRPGSRPFWFPPGGGIEPGESAGQAALRELHEETGLVLEGPGPHVYDRVHELVWAGVPTRVEETWFFATCAPFEIDTSGFTELERATIGAHRWWTLEEMDEATEILVPRDLPQRVRSLLAHGPPEVPEVLGI